MKLTIRNLTAFEGKIAALSRRAKKLGLEEITFTIDGERQEEVDVFEVAGLEYTKVGRETIIVTDITLLNTNTVRHDGWSFAGTAEPLGEKNIVLSAPGVEIPERFQTSGCFCDHCKSHRTRNKVYIVNKGDEWKQVGRSCLKDFVGNASAENIAKQFEFFGELYIQINDYCRGESDGWTGGGRTSYDTARTLAWTIEVLKDNVFVSASKARETGETATADLVRLAMGDKSATLSDEALLDAEDDIEFINNLAAEQISTRVKDVDGNWVTTINTYLHNIRLVCAAGYHGKSAIGLVASIPSAIDRIKHDEMRRAAQERLKESSKHEGAIGKRIEIVATIIRNYSFDTEWGTCFKSVMEANGNCYVCTTPTVTVDGGTTNPETGDVIKFKGTIKKFDEYNGIKQTILSRPSKATFAQ